MYKINEYFEAESIAEALALLATDHKRQVIAGGTDLLIKMREGKLEEASLVGIGRIQELDFVEETAEGAMRLGPLVTFSRLIRDPLILSRLPILTEAALTVGGPQIRNVATVGGNLCNGVPSADSAPALLAFNTRLKVQSSKGERTVALGDFFRGPGRVDLEPGELLTAIEIDKQDYHGFGSCYIKFSPRKAMDLAIIGVAALCRLDSDLNFAEVRISLGVAGPTPMRCPEAEAYLQGKAATDENLAAAGRLALEAASPRSSVRATQEYREHLIRELTGRALKTAHARAGGQKDA